MPVCVGCAPRCVVWAIENLEEPYVSYTRCYTVAVEHDCEWYISSYVLNANIPIGWSVVSIVSCYDERFSSRSSTWGISEQSWRRMEVGQTEEAKKMAV